MKLGVSLARTTPLPRRRSQKSVRKAVTSGKVSGVGISSSARPVHPRRRYRHRGPRPRHLTKEPDMTVTRMVAVAGVEIEFDGSHNRLSSRQMRKSTGLGILATLAGVGRNVRQAARFLTGIGQEPIAIIKRVINGRDLRWVVHYRSRVSVHWGTCANVPEKESAQKCSQNLFQKRYPPFVVLNRRQQKSLKHFEERPLLRLPASFQLGICDNLKGSD